MKILLVLILVLNTLSQVIGQTVGIKTGSNLGFTSDLQTIQEIYPTLTAGFYYSQKISKRLEISPGINYLQIKDVYTVNKTDMGEAIISSSPEGNNYRGDILDFPVELIFDGTMPQDSKWRFFVIGAYSPGFIIKENFNPEGNYNSQPDTRERYLNIFNFGFEVGRVFFNNIKFSWGIQYVYIKNYLWDSPYNDVSIYLKTGFNFKSHP